MEKCVGLLRKMGNALMEALYPSNIYCICCGSLIEKDRAYSLCDRCMEDIHWINGRSCPICGKELNDNYKGKVCYNCMNREHVFEKGISCMTYGLKERQMILDYKYNGKGYMGREFGEILADRLAAENWQIDCAVPVPVHKKREKSRGYNQTAIMTERMCEISDIPYRKSGLARVKYTNLLRSMTPIEREVAMKDAFAVPKNEIKYIEGMNILLVDDIITTGATLDSCSQALMDAGAYKVFVLTLAAGANRKP